MNEELEIFDIEETLTQEMQEELSDNRGSED